MPTALNTSRNITLNSDETRVYFFFGPEVFVPKDNVLISTEQCFEIGIHSTVIDHPSLVHGSRIYYWAVVETDFGIRSNWRSIRIDVIAIISFAFP